MQKVTVIITTKNEERNIKTLLKSITTQSYKNFEIVVVDNNSTDKTKEIAAKFTKNVYNKGPERSVQRNYGVSKAKGEFILILDADMKLTKDALKQIAEKFEGDKNLGALVIPEKSFGTGFWTKFKVFEREFYVGDSTVEAARAFRKNVFQKFKGYDRLITGPEDYDLPLRIKKAGYGIGRIKSYIYHNEGKFSPVKSAKKKFYYFSHAKVYLKRHPEMTLKQGFRLIFFKKWKKLINHPFLSLGMFFVKTLEAGGALLGVIYSGIITNNEK